MRGRCGALLLGSMGLGCGPSLTAETQWVQWFSYREVVDMAVTPAGETVVAGRSTGDERVTGAPFGQSTWRPWVARVADDGTLVESWTGFVGRANAVAVDAEGGAYVLLTGLRDDSDWSAPERCELRALTTDGAIRWSQRWDEGLLCATDLVVAADAVIVQVDERVEAYELDGRLRWQQERPGDAGGFSPMSAHGDVVWMTYESTEDLVVTSRLWRLDGRDGESTTIEPALGERELALGPVQSTEEGLLMMATPRAVRPPTPAGVVLISLSLEGELRWIADLPGTGPEATGPWRLEQARLAADASAPWVVGTDQLQAEDSTQDRNRFFVQRWSTRGERLGTIQRSFVELEDDPEQLARAECPHSDADVGLQVGSRAVAGVVGSDGALRLAGRQGCRDSFLVRLQMEVER